MKAVLIAILSTLNLVEVKGQTNLALLYSAMAEVKKLIDNFDTQQTTKEGKQDVVANSIK